LLSPPTKFSTAPKHKAKAKKSSKEKDDSGLDSSNFSGDKSKRNSSLYDLNETKLLSLHSSFKLVAKYKKKTKSLLIKKKKIARN
jgi:hypothetical protein